jgi:hypothetical protein
VEFAHPEELRAALPLAIAREGCGDEELQKIRLELESMVGALLLQ